MKLQTRNNLKLMLRLFLKLFLLSIINTFEENQI